MGSKSSSIILNLLNFKALLRSLLSDLIAIEIAVL